MITTLYSEARLPSRRIGGTLNAVYGLELSASCINSALVNVSESLQPLVDDVREEINSADSAGFDETSMPVNGDNAWVWAAVTKQCAFIAVEHSRGADVLEKHFKQFDGIAIVDGWKAYNIFDKRQRCWAHIIRDADALALRIGNAGAIGLAESQVSLSSYEIRTEGAPSP